MIMFQTDSLVNGFKVPSESEDWISWISQIGRINVTCWVRCALVRVKWKLCFWQRVLLLSAFISSS